ncbi:MAG: hypothetical protein K1X78_23440 [Verrucomicrobiaceae bacterium]|nr:hypothetical protein [Verrucomicrobiaceae bacterium]
MHCWFTEKDFLHDLSRDLGEANNLPRSCGTSDDIARDGSIVVFNVHKMDELIKAPRR